MDLQGKGYSFPQQVAITNIRPDLVIWSGRSIKGIELTIPFEEGMEAAAERKKTNYRDLLSRCTTT